MQDMKLKMQKAIDRFESEIKKVRTGRASASALDGVMVDIYGQPTPLSHAANVTSPDATSLVVTPYDVSNIAAIVTAIRDDYSLGLNPTDDGRIVRVPMPPMTEETRKEAAKNVGRLVEEAKISMRQARTEFLSKQKSDKKEGIISEDDFARSEKEVDQTMSKMQSDLEALAKEKEQEIMTI